MTGRKEAKISERGWTFIEATIGAVLASVIVLGLAVTMMAMRETVDRSLAIRIMDQYGNNVMKHFETAFETANVYVTVPSQSSGQMDMFELHYRDPFTHVYTIDRYRATQNYGIMLNNQRLDPEFPPRPMPQGKAFGVLNEGESFAITRFTAENVIRRGNTIVFTGGSVRITLTIRYTREANNPGEQDYHRFMTYETMCFMKNMFVSEE
jgi:hypothetical protein